jgi:SAM-dependent methyltransferase/catechol 2,3-dioxygenase-like lactoylglutathione lyase family enzyme
MIDHVTIYVNDLAASKSFYEKIFMPFNFKIAFGDENKFWAFDIGNGALFEIAQYKNADKLTSCHIAFRAITQKQVHEFHEAGLAAGGKCNGAPGLRPHYTETYYAAFIIDPNGHNIEAVFDSKHYKISESDPYQPGNIPLYDAIYGKNLISLGGLAAIDNMFSDLNIQGLKALDLGFGLGGVAYYLAEKYKMKVSGIEIHPWMVEYATNHIPPNLSDALEFHTYNNGNLPFQSESFDLVYSKGVLNHVADKASLFKQINTALKSNGLFVIADWIFPNAATENTVPLVCETRDSYEQVLIDTGFSEISFRDDSKSFLNYAKELLKNLTINQDFIKQSYGEELFLIIQKQHEDLIEKIQQHQKIATRIVAKKL